MKMVNNRVNANLRKGDQVMVITGKGLGKSGKILFMDRKRERVIVEGLNLAKKAVRPSQVNPKGGIIEIETAIAISNVMYLCGKCNKQTRIGKRILEDGSNVRFCKKCGEIIDRGF